MNKLNINFDTPEHGWMRVNISSPTNSTSLDVSDVPCNSLHDLTKSLINLAEGSSEEKVEWSLEPEYAEWRFVKNNNEIHFTVNIPRQKNPSFEFQCEGSKLVEKIYKSLRDLESKSVWNEPNYLAKIWSWEFPSKLLQDLSSKLK